MPNVLFCLLQSRDKKLPSSSTHGSTPKPNWKPKALDEEYVQSKGAKVRAPSQGAGGGVGNALLVSSRPCSKERRLPCGSTQQTRHIARSATSSTARATRSDNPFSDPVQSESVIFQASAPVRSHSPQ